MGIALIAQVLGISLACGFNLYATVAALGLLSRLGIIDGLPVGLHGLEGTVVIASALVLFLVEAVLDKIRHADSLWDIVHTFVRPPAAALLAIGILWGLPSNLMSVGAIVAFVVALAAHAAKAGFRIARSTAAVEPPRVAPISVAEDILAVGLAVVAVEAPPEVALSVIGVVALALLIFGPALWRAFGLGLRGFVAWLRAFFSPPRWRDVADLPRDVRSMLPEPPLGAGRPRAARAGLRGVRAVGDFRSGWLVLTHAGPVFLYRTLLGSRLVDLPLPREVEHDTGVWADFIHVGTEPHYTVYMLKDGPAVAVARSDLEASRP
jgi:hypothetical protein